MDKVLSSEIPNKPGIYIFKDKDGNPISIFNYIIAMRNKNYSN